jgi:hypothetical protein
VVGRRGGDHALLGLGPFVGQAFLYNAVYVTEALVLGKFFGVSGGSLEDLAAPLSSEGADDEVGT